MAKKRPIIFVSSTVYGVEELLDRIYSQLNNFGYEVWMSHKGTLPVDSNLTAFQNCLRGVENCDLFLALITPRYGSGIDTTNPDSLSITHQEIKKAIELNKKRWILTHDYVVFARQLINDLGYKTIEERKKLTLRKGAFSITDLKIIDMYEDATREEEKLDDRIGNWVQKYRSDSDSILFITAQFSRFQEAEAFIEENFPKLNEEG